MCAKELAPLQALHAFRRILWIGNASLDLAHYLKPLALLMELSNL